MHERALDAVVFLCQVQRQTEVFDNRLIALDDAVKIRVEFLAAHCLFKAGVEHVGDFGVVFRALAGGRGDNVSSGGVFMNDLGYFAEMFRIGERRTAEFDDFYLHFSLLAGKIGLHSILYVGRKRVSSRKFNSFRGTSRLAV